MMPPSPTRRPVGAEALDIGVPIRLFAIACSLPLYLITDSPATLTWLIVTFSATAGLCELYLSVRASPIFGLEPKAFVSLMFLILICARPLVVLSDGLATESFARALLMSFWGYLTYCLGHALGGRGTITVSARPYRSVWDNRRLTLTTAVLGAISASCLLFLIASQGGIRGLLEGIVAGYRNLYEGRGYLLVGANVLRYAAFALLLRDLQQRSKPQMLSLTLTAVALLIAASGGSRTSMIVLLLSSAMAIVLVRRRRARAVLLGALGTSLLLVVAYRLVVREGALIAAPHQRDDITRILASGSTAASFFDRENFGMIEIFGDTIDAIESGALDYQYGKTYLSLATQPIPRKWFPGKLGGAGETLTRAINPDLWERGSGYHFSMFGELYLNFGTFGVLLGMFCFGFFSRRVRDWVVARRHQVAVIGLYSVSLIRFASVLKGEFLSVASGWLLDFTLLGIVLWISVRHSQETKP